MAPRVGLVDLLLPERCAACRWPGRALCERCRLALPLIRAPLCGRCGAPTAWPVERCRECAGRRLAFRSARAAVAYDAAVRAIVSAWKEHGRRRLALLAVELVAGTLVRPDATAITFVPPDADRHLRRGHHPAERLARGLGESWGLPVEALLARASGLPPQRGLHLAERRKNVAGAFRALERAPTSVILVDDVYTSGATASAASTVLRRSGARSIEVVTFARAVR